MTKKNKILYISLMVLSVLLTIVMCLLTNEKETTISAMQAKYPSLGIIWSLLAAFTVFLNLEFLRKECEIENIWFKRLIAIGSFSVILTPFTLPESPIGFTLSFIDLHLISAIFFAATCYISLIIILITHRQKHKTQYMTMSLILSIIALVSVYEIFSMGGYITAPIEAMLLISGLVALFVTNFVLDDKTEVNEKTQVLTNENYQNG